MFILCNPHNPTGRVFKREELKKLSNICAENNVLIVADEIHGDLIRRDQTFIPIAKAADKTIILLLVQRSIKHLMLAGFIDKCDHL